MNRTVNEFEIGLLGKLYCRQKIIEKEVANALLGYKFWEEDLDPTKEEIFKRQVLNVPVSYTHLTLPTKA